MVTDEGRLRWRCRRGMRELDQLLLHYLETRWPQAQAQERSAFDRLLAIEDDRLWRLFVGAEDIEDAQISRLIEHIAASRA